MQIKNIIFDYGGVILNINTDLIAKYMHEAGEKNIEALHKKLIAEDIYNKVETGEISGEEFIRSIKEKMQAEVSEQEVENAWNSLILDMPPKRIRLLEEVRKNYRIFMLSNTNEIHYQKYRADLEREYGYKSFDEIFEKAWFSHNLGMRKPGTEIFEHVLKEASLDPKETLFIDDTFVNVEGASFAGMAAFYLEDGIDVTDLFDDGKLVIDLEEVIQ